MAEQPIQSPGDTTDTSGGGGSPQPGTPTVKSLRESVEAGIAGSGDEVVAKVVAHYVDAEKERRAKLLVAGHDAVRQAEADLKKIDRPNNVQYNADGSVASQTYDKATLTTIKKGRERVDKLTAALNAVLANPTADTYKKLDDTIKKGGKGGGGNSSDDSDGDGEE